MKRIVIVLAIAILAIAAYVGLEQYKSTDIKQAPLVTFTWRYQEGALNLDGIPGTKIFLDAMYANDKVLSKEIDEVDGSCNEILPSEEDTDIVEGSSKIQCYAAGLGQWFKITKGENSYEVMRKIFEEALPDSTSPAYQYEPVAEFPTVY